MNRLIDKLKNMLTAMAYAEAGDFDAVKQILRLESESDKLKSEKCTTKECSRQPMVSAT